jgi:hypothetical protein
MKQGSSRVAKFEILVIYCVIYCEYDIPSISAGRASGHEPHQHFPSHFYQFETSKKHQTTRCRPSSQRALTLGIWFQIMQLFWAQSCCPACFFA